MESYASVNVTKLQVKAQADGPLLTANHFLITEILCHIRIKCEPMHTEERGESKRRLNEKTKAWCFARES